VQSTTPLDEHILKLPETISQTQSDAEKRSNNRGSCVKTRRNWRKDRRIADSSGVRQDWWTWKFWTPND